MRGTPGQSQLLWVEGSFGEPQDAVPPPKSFGFVQTYDRKPRRRLWELMKSQGMQENQQIVFLSDGGEDVRQIQEYLHPNSEHVIDWFHITMRLTVYTAADKGAAGREATARRRGVEAGGLLVFQEFDTANCRSLPVAPVFERSVEWIKQTLHASGARIQLGLELYPVFLAAGLAGPSLRMDALIGGGLECPRMNLWRK
jgi:hypothetical protein